MTTKPKRRLDGTPRPHPSRSRPGWGFRSESKKRISSKSLLKTTITLSKESQKTAQQVYHEYHSLENKVARAKASQDVRRMRKFARAPGREGLVEQRNRINERFKEKRAAKTE